ncbi:hypothetical protein Nepgr_000206 [Nepenthes gracilis]|uniref:Thionin-like protein n=1 Tax=Nepenthes gracilis TaxID=150966 RepID=A0AAD3RVC4_NEPGR|nr:hypothetical protein Nepgr_000206 [Nepenthes gracilis]
MMKKTTTTTIFALVILLCVLSLHIDTAEAIEYDCYDACTTACVSLDPRVVARCDRKCSIKCGPPASATGLKSEDHID